MLNITDFTPTQQRILKVLQDGHPHPKRELNDCIDDELAAENRNGCKKAITFHLSGIRKVLRPKGYDLVTTLGRGQIWYVQWVRRISNPWDE